MTKHSVVLCMLAATPSLDQAADKKFARPRRLNNFPWELLLFDEQVIHGHKGFYFTTSQNAGSTWTRGAVPSAVRPLSRSMATYLC